MKITRMLGKEGRTTIPYELRLKLGFCNKDVIVFEETDDKNVILLRKVPFCTGCTESDQITEEEKILEEFISLLTPEQKMTAFRILRGNLLVQGGKHYA